jgi:hypothetical protein
LLIKHNSEGLNVQVLGKYHPTYFEKVKTQYIVEVGSERELMLKIF